MANDYTLKEKGIIRADATKIYPSVDAMYGPWASVAAFRTYLGEILGGTVTDDIIPNSVEIGIIQEDGTVKRYEWKKPTNSQGSWVEVINVPNKEDIDYDSNGKLQFANRVVATNQKGYKILRNGVALASQMTDANTIYDVRYAFDLNGSTLTIPSGCTLKFDGGQILNGQIESDDLNVVADSKCFDNITFGGRFKSFGVVKLSWFIDEYPSSVDDTTIDNTSDIQFVMDDSGAMNVEFPTDKYLRITDTIYVQRAVNIIAQIGQKRIPESQSAVGGNRLPCVFSKSVVTLFDYDINGIDGTDATASYPISIGAVNLYVDCEYNDLSDKTTPIIKFKTNYNGSVYGLVVDANIVSKRHEITIGEDTDFINDYTAVLIEIYKGSLSYIKINGSIFGTYYGIVTTSTTSDPSNNWITDITLNGNSWCCYGGKFDVGYPVIIFGSHQCSVTDTDQATPLAYFTGNYITVYGKVWDAGSTSSRSSLKNAALAMKQTKSEVYMTNPSNMSVRPMALLDSISNPSTTGLDFSRNMPMNVQNLLNLHRANNNVIKSLVYTIDGEDVFTSGKVYNTDKIFNEGVWGTSTINTSPTYFNDAHLPATNANMSLSFEAVIDKSPAGFFSADYQMLLYFRYYRSQDRWTMTISHSGDNATYSEFKSESGSGFFYGTLARVYNLSNTYRYVKITLSITSSGTRPLILPTLFIPSISSINVDSFGTTSQRPLLRAMRKGVEYFDTTIGRAIWWNGTKWITNDGESAGISRSGTFANKPTPTNKGFQYFCTSGASIDGGTTEKTNIVIYYTGSGWVDANGNAVVAKA